MQKGLVALLLCMLLGISACGNKGPLTLPEEEEKKAQRVDY